MLLRGVGQRYSGTYFVRTVRTTLEEGVLTQTFIAESRELLEAHGAAVGATSWEEVACPRAGRRASPS